MSSIAWFPFYIGDYLKDTQELSPIEHGMYLKLILWYYTKGKPIPHIKRYSISGANDVSSDNHMMNMSDINSGSSFELCDYLLKEFFVRDGDVWIHNRIEMELEKQRDISEKRKKAVQAREKKRSSSDKSNDDHVITQSQSQSHSKKDIDKSISKKGKKEDGHKFTPERYFTERWKQIAIDGGIDVSDLQFEDTCVGFRDYYTVGKGKSTKSTERGWDARWRRWLKNEYTNFGRTEGQRGRKQGGDHDAVLAGWSEAVNNG